MKYLIPVLALFCSTLFAAPPGIIGHNGRVTVGGVNFNGTGHFKFALVNGDATMTFWNHDDSQGTQQEPDDANALQLTVTNGLFSVGLGDTTIPDMVHDVGADIFRDNDDVRLKTWFSDSGVPASFQEMLPDQRIVSVGFALSVPLAGLSGPGGQNVIEVTDNGQVSIGGADPLNGLSPQVDDRGVTSVGLSTPRSVAVQGDIAYVLDNGVSEVLALFDVSDPNSIQALGSVGTGLGNPVEVVVQDDVAYVIDSLTDMLLAFDVSDPLNPSLLDTDSTNISNPRDLAVEGNLVLVVDSTTDVLQVFDVSTPSNIVARGSTGFGLSVPVAVELENNIAVVTDNGGNSLFTFDVSNPDVPVPLDLLGTGLSVPSGLVLRDGLAYVTDVATDALLIFDVSTPANIQALDTDGTGLSVPRAVAVQGPYAYVAEDGANTVAVFDVSDPNNIVAVGAGGGGLDQPFSIAVQGSHAFVADQGGSLLAFEVIPPLTVGGTIRVASGGVMFADGSVQRSAALTEIGSAELADGAVTTAKLATKAVTGAKIALNSVNSNHIINGTIKSGDIRNFDIRGIDIGNGQITSEKLAAGAVDSAAIDPSALSELNSPDGLVSNALHVSNAGLIGIGPGDQTADANQAQVLVARGADNRLDQGGDVDVEGDLAVAVFFGFPDNAVAVYDVSDPAQVVLLATNATLNAPAGVDLAGNFAYVTDAGSDVLAIFDISVPTNIVPRGTVTFPIPRAVQVQGDRAWVVDGGLDSLSAVDVSDPDNPVIIGTETNTLVDPRDVALSGDFAYVTDELLNTVQVFDISNPSNIVALAPIAGFSNPRDIHADGNRLYVGDSSGPSVAIFDITNPGAPAPLGVVTSTLGGIVEAVGAQNHRLVMGISGGDTALELFDVTDPANPVLLDVTEAGVENPRRLLVSNGFVYLADNTGASSTDSFNIYEIQAPRLTVDGSLRLRTGEVLFSDGSSLGSGKDFGDLRTGILTAGGSRVEQAYHRFAVSDGIVSDHGLFDGRDVFIESDLEVNGSLFADGNIFAKEDIQIGTANATDDDAIRFDSGLVILKWDESEDHMDLNQDLAVAGVIQSGSIGANQIYNRMGTGVTSHSLNNTSDLLVSDDLEVNDDVFVDGDLLVSGSSADDDDHIYFDNVTDERLSWENAESRFLLSDDLVLAGVIQTGNTAQNTGYNRMGSGTSSHGLSSLSDLYITRDLEVDDDLFVDDALFMSGSSADDNDIIYFDSGTTEFLEWDNAKSRFEFSDTLSVVTLNAGNGALGSTSVTFNYISNVLNPQPDSGDISSTGDLYINADLEVNDDVYIYGTLSELSDRNAKENFKPVDVNAVLDKVGRLPMQTWNYITDDDEQRHMGPMAQDFKAAFDLGGPKNTMIATKDLHGVALASIQALLERIKELEKKIEGFEQAQE